MPPRKSTDSAGGLRPTDEEDSKKTSNGGLGIEDLNLPRSMIARLAKGVLPLNTQLQKDALLALSKSATVFVNYLTANANSRVALAGKKTIQPKDIFEALAELEFDSFIPRAEAELLRYNAVQCDKRNSYRRRVREEQKATTATSDAGADSAIRVAGGSSSPDHLVDDEDMNGDGLAGPAKKRARTDGMVNGNGGAGEETVDEDEVEEEEEEDGEDDADGVEDAEEEDENVAEDDEDEAEEGGEEENGDEDEVEDEEDRLEDSETGGGMAEDDVDDEGGSESE